MFFVGLFGSLQVAQLSRYTVCSRRFLFDLAFVLKTFFPPKFKISLTSRGLGLG
jgi:hypothetical protein